MAERDQTQDSGQRPPIARDNDNEITEQAGEQPSGQQGQQPAGSEGSEPDLGGTPSSGGFVGSQNQDPGDYLQRDGNPDTGFAEQGRGAPDQGDIERTGERSDNRDSDIEGGSGAT